MRGLLFVLALTACGKSTVDEDHWKAGPSDRSLQFHGSILDEFCRAQEREPGWTCDDYEACETSTIDNLTVCRAKLAPGS